MIHQGHSAVEERMEEIYSTKFIACAHSRRPTWSPAIRVVHRSPFSLAFLSLDEFLRDFHTSTAMGDEYDQAKVVILFDQNKNSWHR